MNEFEYILKVGRYNIDIVNKITEAYEGIGVVRTIDANEGIIKILTNEYFIADIEIMLDKISKYFNITIEIISKHKWLGEI